MNAVYFHHSRALALGLLLTALSLSSGCVRRRMTVLTNVPGATVYVNEQEAGTTPTSFDFTHYGPRKIQVVKDGYKTTTVTEDVRAPWYQITPIDFFAENFWPSEIRDERVVRIEMEPQPVVPVDEVWQRAEQLRGASRAGYAAPLPPR